MKAYRGMVEPTFLMAIDGGERSPLCSRCFTPVKELQILTSVNR